MTQAADPPWDSLSSLPSKREAQAVLCLGCASGALVGEEEKWINSFHQSSPSEPALGGVFIS